MSAASRQSRIANVLSAIWELDATVRAVADQKSLVDSGEHARAKDRAEPPADRISFLGRPDAATVEQAVSLATEIAREGREGRVVGTIFVVGDADAVLKRSRPLILDPLAGHPYENKLIHDKRFWETLKELAQLDEAFVVSGDGVLLIGVRHLDTYSSGGDVPAGLGSRHVAAASISASTQAGTLTVSESRAVRVFEDGRLILEVTLCPSYGGAA